jgi:hypothetical protein
MSRYTRSRARRQMVRVPVRIRHAGGTFVSTARDVSATGLSVQAPIALAVGAEVFVTMFAPGRTWQGAASVARADLRPSGDGFNTWITGIRFQHEPPVADVDPFRRSDAA